MPFFSTLRLKYKLILAFLLILVPLTVIGGYVLHVHAQRTLTGVIEQSLRDNADNLVKMVDTTARVAIRNHLRAVAEQNLEMLTRYWEAYQSNSGDRALAIQAARRLLANQRIGETGYIYCINSQGDILYHPHKALEGDNVSTFPFIREQLGRREGYLEYEWRNPGEHAPRAKALYMVYFEPLDWILSVSAYRDEFNHLVHLDDFRDNVLSLRFGVSGQAFVLGSGGRLLVHPNSNGERTIGSLIEAVDPPMADLAELGVSIRTRGGTLTYRFKDPDTGEHTLKIAYLDHLPDFGWYVGTAHSLEDIHAPLRNMRRIIVLTALGMVLIAALVATRFSDYINSHIDGLIAAFKGGASGFFKERLPIRTKDELGTLAHYFNLFMERLEGYQRDLLEEIDKRREAQNAVYASEQRIKNLVRNAPLVLWAIDGEGRLTFYEGALPLAINQGEEPLLGYPLNVYWSEWQEVPAHIATALAGGSGMAFIERETYALEIYYNPLYDDEHVLEGVVGVVIDVTSRRKAERERDMSEQQRQKLVMAVEQAAEIVIITDRQGIIEYVNPAFEKISGYSSAEVLGRKPALLKSGHHDHGFYETLWRTISAGRVWSGRFVNKRKDGSLYHEDATIAPIVDEGGRTVNYVASKRDVSAEIVLEQQLQRSERMKALGTLARGIAHDFNNMLAGIMGFTEVCLLEAPKESRMHQRLEKVMQACLRAKELIGHIQAFSRQQAVVPIAVQPAPLVNEAIKLVRVSFPRTIQFRSDIQPVGAIRAVPAELHQVVMNLCTNACQAMQPEGGTLTITLRRETVDADSARQLPDVAPGPYVQLIVSDTGHGIPADRIERIFEPDFTTKTEGQGSGVGLSVVHGIVRKMGGAITVASTPGAGATFIVRLPDMEKDVEEAVQQLPDTGVEGAGPAVLVVDGEADALATMKEMLESLGCRVTVSNNADAALQSVQDHPRAYDLLITDFVLPGSDGIQLAKRLRELRPDLPILISTGFSDKERIEVLDRGDHFDWIHKPIIRSELAAKVRAGMARAG